MKFKLLLVFLLMIMVRQLFAQAPVITSFTPSIGSVGTLVTVTGTDLGSTASAAIGGVPAIVISSTSTQTVAMVMPGAATGPVSISTNGGLVTSSLNFTLSATSYPSVQQGPKLPMTDAYLQGKSVAISADGNTAVVGGKKNGSVIVFTRSNGSWVQQGAALTGDGSVGDQGIGLSVAISADGNTLLFGSPTDNGSVGAAWVFTRTNGVWIQQGSKLVGTGSSGQSNQGNSVSLSADGNTAVIGGSQDRVGSGAVWVFKRTVGTWAQQGSRLVGNDNVTGGFQGSSVAISADGKTIAEGAIYNDTSGAVWVFTLNGTTWIQQGSKLVGSNASANAEQGFSVALSADGNTLIEGGIFDAYATSNSNTFTGACWVFTRTNGAWSQQGAKINPAPVNLRDSELGYSVSLSADGNTAIAGAPVYNNGSGEIFVFTRNSGIWSQQLSTVGTGGNSGVQSQGSAVAISADGGTAIVGGSGDFNSTYGSAWIFQMQPPPGITSFTPSSGAVGSLVTITGSNFGTITGASVGGVPAIIISSTSTQVVAMVMPGAATGAVTLTNANSTGTSSGSFTVTATSYPSTQQGPQLQIANANHQGGSLAISADGSTAVVGVGPIMIYTRSNGQWMLQTTLASSVAGHVAISADGNTLLIGGNATSGVSTTSVFTRTAGTWTQQVSAFVGTGAVGDAAQGTSVSLSADGNTAIIGGKADNSKIGAIWVFKRTGATWVQQGNKLVGTGYVSAGGQGTSVSISADGNTIASGAPGDNGGIGAVWIFTQNGNVWSQQGNKLVGSGNNGTAAEGMSVALSADGNILVEGGPNDFNNVTSSTNGACWTFIRSGNIWSQQGAKFAPQSYNAQIGYSVAISADGNTYIAGAPYDNINSGDAYVVSRIGNGSILTSQVSFSRSHQGMAVALSADGSTAMMGAPDDYNSSLGAFGSVAIFGVAPPAPVVTSITPTSGPVGTPITITGTNLNYPKAVTVGGTNAVVVSNSGTQLVALVMPGTVTGAVKITTVAGSNLNAPNFTVTATPFPNQQQGAKLQAATGSLQGTSIAVSADGTTAVIGGAGNGDAWIYTRSGTTWTQQSKLTGNDAVNGLAAGTSVAITPDGNMVAIGEPGDNGGVGAVWIYTRSAGVWTQQGSKIVSLGTSTGSAAGKSVALSATGDVLVIGVPGQSNATGMIVIYKRIGGVLTQFHGSFTGTGYVFTSVNGIMQGSSVAITPDGNTIAVGGYGDNNSSGAVWVFQWDGSTYSQQGNKLVGTGYGGSPKQGSSVALSADGNTLVVGGPFDINTNISSITGALWVFTRASNTWTQQGGKLSPTPAVVDADLGSSVGVSADGNTIAAGAPGYNSGVGAMFTFTRSGGTWTQRVIASGKGQTVSRPLQGGAAAISADGNYGLIGGSADGSGLGASWVFTAGSQRSVAVTQAATLVTPTTATLNGTVSDNNSPTAVIFEYSTAASFISSVTAAVTTGTSPIAAGTGTVSFTAALTGLAANTPYYYRINGINGSDTTHGSILNFTTQSYNLDKIGTLNQPASAAYSLRQLKKTYAHTAITPPAAVPGYTNSVTPVIRVRRSADNALLDVGYTANGDLDTTTLKNFAVASNVFIATWYDQSGHNRDVIQTNLEQQPYIITAGTVERSGTMPAVRFVGAKATVLQATIPASDMFGSGYMGSAFPVFEAAKANTTSSAFGYAGSLDRWQVHSCGGAFFDVGNPFTRVSTLDEDAYTGVIKNYTMLAGTNLQQVYVNGTLKSSATTPLTACTQSLFTIGGIPDFSYYHTNHESELIFYGTALADADRQTVENNQAKYYSTKAIPEITAFSPQQGGPGTSVTITGSGFTGTTSVKFGGVPASSFTVNSDNTITAIVGAGAAGDVTVTNTKGTGTISGGMYGSPLDKAGSSSQLASAAYSLRQLKTTYTHNTITPPFAVAGSTNSLAPVVRVRRTSDGNQLDIGYTANGDLDTTTLKTFVGTGDGYVTIWYDQSGHNRDVVQTIPNQQPYIVTAGTVERSGAMPAIRFVGASSTVLQVTVPASDMFGSGYMGTAFPVFEAAKANTTSSAFGYAGSLDRWQVHSYGGAFFDVGNPFNRVSVVDEATYTGIIKNYTMLAGTNLQQLYVNGTLKSSATTPLTACTQSLFTIGGIPDFSYYHTNHESELIFYGSALTDADRQSVESSQSTYYSINPPVIAGPSPLDRTGNTTQLASAAYSLRQLKNSYTHTAITPPTTITGFTNSNKPVIRVRRSADNALLDVGYTVNGDLDTTTLKNFAVAGNVLVATWYDQSGYNRDVVQTNPNQQPYIITAGVVERSGAMPAVRFVGVNATVLQVTVPASDMFGSGYMGTAFPVFEAAKANTTSSAFGYGGYLDRWQVHSCGGAFFDVGNPFTRVSVVDEATYTGVIKNYTMLAGTNLQQLYVNGVLKSSATTPLTACTQNLFTVGGIPDFSYYHTNHESELIFYGSALADADRQTVEDNQAAYYSTKSIPQITAFSPHQGGPGTSVTITGQGFTGTTSVTFGGVPASSFTVNSDNTITAIVGAGAAGDVTVSNLKGTGTISGGQYGTPLDKAGNNTLLASAAYSLRQLKTTYTHTAITAPPAVAGSVNSTTPVIRVCKSDGAQLDIGYTAGGDLDTTSLKSFAGTDNAYVTIWYDQSGHSRDVVQTSPGQQPFIVTAGTIERSGAMPAVRFVGSSQTVLQTTVPAGDMFGSGYMGTVFPVYEAAKDNTTSSAFGYSGSLDRWQVHSYGGALLDVGNPFTRVSVEDEATYTGVIKNYTMLAGTNKLQLYVNGTLKASSGTPLTACTQSLLNIGGVADFSYYHTNHESELIFYGSALTDADRQAVETSQHTYYFPQEQQANSQTQPTNMTVSLKQPQMAAYSSTVGLDFTSAGGDGTTSYQVQKLSATGAGYSSVTTMNGSGTGSYKANDSDPLNGDNFYRVLATDSKGKTAVSETVKLNIAAGGKGIQVYPVPVMNKQIVFNFSKMEAGNYDVTIVSKTGYLIGKQTIRYNGYAGSVTIAAPANKPTEVYFITIASPAYRRTEKVIIE